MVTVFVQSTPIPFLLISLRDYHYNGELGRPHGPPGPAGSLSSRDLHVELSDPTMLCPVQSGPLFERHRDTVWVPEPSYSGMNMEPPLIIHMSLDYLRSLNTSQSQFPFLYKSDMQCPSGIFLGSNKESGSEDGNGLCVWLPFTQKPIRR